VHCEILVSGDATIGIGARVHAVVAEGTLRLEPGVRIDSHAEGVCGLIVSFGASVKGRATSPSHIVLEPGASVGGEQLLAGGLVGPGKLPDASSALAPGSYLATHWNLAGTNNRYVQMMRDSTPPTVNRSDPASGVTYHGCGTRQPHPFSNDDPVFVGVSCVQGSAADAETAVVRIDLVVDGWLTSRSTPKSASTSAAELNSRSVGPPPVGVTANRRRQPTRRVMGLRSTTRSPPSRSASRAPCSSPALSRCTGSVRTSPSTG
jgi:hypothetical protein